MTSSKKCLFRQTPDLNFAQLLLGLLVLSWGHLCVSWGILGNILVHFGAILGHLRTILGYSGAILQLSRGGLELFGVISGHLGGISGPRPFWKSPSKNHHALAQPSWPILEPISGPKINQFMLIWFFGDQIISGPILRSFWDLFWDQIGPRRGQDKTKKAIKSFKYPKSCICKTPREP